MKTIIIPTDFSVNARNAFEYAVAIFGQNQQYFLLNAYEEPSSTATSMVSLKDILKEASEDALKEELANIKAEHPNLNIQTVSEYGDPTFSVVNFAARKSAHCIVMGTAGATGLQRIILGSVAVGVIAKAHCPVLVVPKDYLKRTPESILFAADLKNSDNEKLPEVLSHLIETHQSEVTVLTVTKPGAEIKDADAEKGYVLHMVMNGYSHQFDTVEHEDTGFAIRKYIREYGMDLLVATPRKSSWFDRLLKPSVTKDLAEHLEVPMLAIH